MSTEDKKYSQEDLLYLHNVGRKSFQWELWQCCNNLCSFCYLGKENRHTDTDRQLESLRELLAALDNLDFNVYNNVSLIGGEFFQGQLKNKEVRDLFFEVIRKIGDLYASKKIGSVWITATLTIGDQADLYETLNLLEQHGVRPHPDYVSSGIIVCTSWDAEGRFHNQKALENWEYHMNKIHEDFPLVKKNTTIILTQPMCELYLNGAFVPRKFREKHTTDLFYKQPGIPEFDSPLIDGLPTLIEESAKGRAQEEITKIKRQMNEQFGFQFCPDRKTFRKFLIKYAKEDADTFDRLFNIEYRADECHRNYNDEEEFEEVRDKEGNIESTRFTLDMANNLCLLEPKDKKHLVIYASYSDGNECMFCDRERIRESVLNGR